MALSVAHLYRHPVKSLGEEAIDTVKLTTGCHMPWDRVWAIAHGDTHYDPANPEWVRARSFVTQTFVPTLAQITVSFDENTGVLRLDHPARPTLEIEPDTPEGAEALTDWIAPLAADRYPGPYTIARLPDGALTDFPDTHLLICNTATLGALEDIAGKPLEHIRFRANMWIDGLEPWQELDLGGAELTIGEARLTLAERCERCNATTANSETGERDVQVPALLRRNFRHKDFGIYARVTQGGRVAVGDKAAL